MVGTRKGTANSLGFLWSYLSIFAAPYCEYSVHAEQQNQEKNPPYIPPPLFQCTGLAWREGIDFLSLQWHSKSKWAPPLKKKKAIPHNCCVVVGNLGWVGRTRTQLFKNRHI
ncbi:UNVERIFIED_CONTAM: hypothetical protein K2H54_069444 [Gekko kuhli]